MGQEDSSQLLNQLEQILESDPLIDEIGFIHPSQFATLNEESNINSDPSESKASDTFFWNKDHKLGISTANLLMLYNAAKHAFLETYKQYKMVNKEKHEDDTLERTLMKHSRALLMLSCDYGTAWNCRKQIVSKQHNYTVFMNELHLSSLVLSYSPKSECAWSHRRWVIKKIAGNSSHLQEIIEKESEIVKKLAEKSKMNYRAWNHRCWVVSYMNKGQVLHEISKTKDWAKLHVADSSCFHYLARLMLRLLEDSRHCKDSDANSSVDLHKVWKEEFDWVETLMKRYIGREALWLHRRFLALCWIKQIANPTHDINLFISNEIEIFESCTVIPDNDFEDYQAQATYAATYIMWLMMHIPESLRFEFQKKFEGGRLKILLNNVCPEKSILWHSLLALCGSMCM